MNIHYTLSRHRTIVICRIRPPEIKNYLHFEPPSKISSYLNTCQANFSFFFEDHVKQINGDKGGRMSIKLNLSISI